MFPPVRSPGRTAWLLPSGVVALTLAVYAPVAWHEFVNYDDGTYVYKNPRVQAGLTRDGVRWALTSTEHSNWHPLTWLTLMADAAVGGESPAAFHVTNLALHAAAVLLLYAALLRMTGAIGRSAFAAACFALHPLHVESVAWVAERKDVLCGVFWFLTLWAYAGYAARPGLPRYLGVAAAFACALASKPMAVTLPFVLLLLDYWPLGRWGRRGSGDVPPPAAALARLVAEKIPLLALSAAACAVTVAAQSAGGAVTGLDRAPPALRVENALVAYVVYLRKAVWPSDLAVLYPLPAGLYPPWQPLAAGVFIAGVTAAAVRWGRRLPYLPVGWFWYLGTLVPVIGLVQVGVQSWADRYAYLPLVGVYLVAAWGVPDLLVRLGQPQRLARVAAALVVISLAALTWVQVGYWRDSVTLWRRTLDLTGDNFVAHMNLGSSLLRREQWADAAEQYATAARLEPGDAQPFALLAAALLRGGKAALAEKSARKALELDPEKFDARLVLGNALKTQGKVREAVPEYREVTRLLPDSPEALNNLGTTLAQLGQFEEAARCLARAESLLSGQPETPYNLGLALAGQGDYAAAAAAFRRAAGLGPSVVKYRLGLAQALHETGKVDESRAEYAYASRLEPDWPEKVNRAAWSLASDPNPARRSGALAVQFGRQLCQATEERRPKFLDALAAAYAESGRFDEAAAYARKALALLPPDGRDTPAVRDRLGLYERRQPYRSAPP